MISEVLFLQSFGFSGTNSIGNFLSQLEQAGVFRFILPFLIIFSLIFGVLSRMNLFGTNSKVPNAIISLSVSLMALQFGFVSQFFSEIFPRLGVWLSVILIIFIVVGLMNPTKTWNKGVMVSVGVIIVGIILYKSFGGGWYDFGYWLPQNWGTIMVIILVIFAVGMIISNTPEKKNLEVPDILKNMFSSHNYS